MISFVLRWILVVGVLIVGVAPQQNRDAGPCNGHGRELTLYRCECDDGWYGDYCSGFDCNSPHGVWNYDQDNPLCTCNEGWEGARCLQSNTTTATAATSPSSNATTNRNATTNSIDLSDLHSPDSTMPVGSESGSGLHTSAALYIGIAIGIAAMCGVMIIAMMYRSRHRFHDLKQRLLNPRLTSASASTELVLMKQPPPVFTTTVTPQLQPAAAGIVCMPASTSTSTSAFAEPQQA